MNALIIKFLYSVTSVAFLVIAIFELFENGDMWFEYMTIGLLSQILSHTIE